MINDSEFEKLAGYGVNVEAALYDALVHIQGPWAKAYQGPKTRSGNWESETPFEKDRAAAYVSDVIRRLDTEVQRVSVQDAMILPGGNRQVITDPQDTIMAFKKGGPLAGLMGGGGENTFNFYINGDKAQMAQEIMRVLKATGNA